MSIRYAIAILIVCGGSGAIGGCGVSKSKHNATVEEMKACKAERESLAFDRDALKNKLSESESKSQEELSASREGLDELRKQRAEMDKQLEEFQSLTSKFQEMIKTEGIKVYVRRGRTIVALPSGVLFASGKAELSPRGQKTLERVAAKLKELADRRFIIAGHTDNVPIGTSGFEDNWQLSAVRALNVTRYLVGQGVKPELLAAAGYAEFDPASSNKSKRGRQKNRRIELIIEPRLPDFAKLTALSKKLNKDDDGDDGKDDSDGDKSQKAK